ncbi:MAG: 50S ribosomal protein L11 methyltransferase [Deltaproteobacteria bacterium]
MNTNTVWIKVEITTSSELVDAVSNFIDEIGLHGCYQETIVEGDDGDGAYELQSINQQVIEKATSKIIAFIPDDMRKDKIVMALDEYFINLQNIFPLLPKTIFTLQNIANPDWDEAWKKYFKPLRIGKHIVIKPSWERYGALNNDIVIEIDPGMAFGTGQHASTSMSLEGIESIITSEHKRKWRVLDVGTGTGILAIACAKLGAQSVVAVDIDSNALNIALENVRINKVQDTVLFSDKTASQIGGTFNLIVANLTAKTLVNLNHDLLTMLEPDGYLIISGIIESNTCEIERIFFNGSFVCHQKNISEGWVSYIIHRQK